MDYDHCMAVLHLWHMTRTDLETKLFHLTQDGAIAKSQSGTYNRRAFHGHCTEDQSKGYLLLAGGNPEVLKRVPELYKSNS